MTAGSGTEFLVAVAKLTTCEGQQPFAIKRNHSDTASDTVVVVLAAGDVAVLAAVVKTQL